MKKDAFYKLVAKKSGLNIKDCKKVVIATLEVIKGLLQNGDFITFKHFGRFKVSKHKARKSLDINLNKIIQHPAPFFRIFLFS